MDYEATRTHPNWRRNVWWPISVQEANAISVSQLRRALGWVADLDDDLARDACLLALPNILAYGRAVVFAALALSRAAEMGIWLDSAAAEFAYLREGGEQVPARAEQILPLAQMQFSFARRLVRLGSWTRMQKVPRAILNPDAVAITHNSLLRAAAVRESKAIGFCHAQTFLDAARSSSTGAAPSLAGLGESLSAIVLNDFISVQPYRNRAADLLSALARVHIETALHDMYALRSARLPRNIWAGSGGPYAPRAVGLEVLRRGGCAVRFGHGTPMSFLAAREIEALLEMAVSSTVVLATEGASRIWRDYTDPNLYPWRPHVDVRGLNGDPIYKAVPSRRPKRINGIRRLVYAPTQLLGFRQLVPCQPPDVIYLDWQLRVAEALRTLPVELICQPHPEGLLQNLRHPLEDIAATVRGNFSAQLTSADIFVFDYPSTTVLWEAACTDARIIFLNIGAGELTSEVAALFRARACILDVPYDEANRPILDVVALRDAVLDDSGSVDPVPFRQLLAGEA